MGNAASGEDTGSRSDDEEIIELPDFTTGYRILGVQANSPGSICGFVSFFDFIVGADDIELKSLDSKFVDIIKSFEDKPLKLTIYNCKGNTFRDVMITPTRNWEGHGMLGVTIRFDTFENADENLVRILEVMPNSPADMAGLQSNNDYLLGTAELVFKDSDVLFAELMKNIDTMIEFFVYNINTDEVRTVVVMPTYGWEGEGCLGASVGHGYLHRLPSKCKNTNGISAISGYDNSNDENDNSNENIISPPPPPPPPPTATATATATATTKANIDINTPPPPPPPPLPEQQPEPIEEQNLPADVPGKDDIMLHRKGTNQSLVDIEINHNPTEN